MEVQLIDYTGSGWPDTWHAARLMAFTKSTRLNVSPDGFREILSWPVQKLQDELAYMANTIRSSWEFCNYTWIATGVTRALTHQLVRTRHGKYAQQTQQVLKVDATNVIKPRKLRERDTYESDEAVWDETVESISAGYEELIRQGFTVEEARGLLPTNISTNIVLQFDLRTLIDTLHQRISPRNLGEYRDLAVNMRDEVLRVHPWAEVFINSTRDKAMAELDAEIQLLYVNMTASESDPIPGVKINRMLKLVDQLRREV